MTAMSTKLLLIVICCGILCESAPNNLFKRSGICMLNGQVLVESQCGCMSHTQKCCCTTNGKIVCDKHQHRPRVRIPFLMMKTTSNSHKHWKSNISFFQINIFFYFPSDRVTFMSFNICNWERHEREKIFLFDYR